MAFLFVKTEQKSNKGGRGTVFPPYPACADDKRVHKVSLPKSLISSKKLSIFHFPSFIHVSSALKLSVRHMSLMLKKNS